MSNNPGGDDKYVLGATMPQPRKGLLDWRIQLNGGVLADETRPLWRDVSAYQGNISAAIMKANGVNGVIMRAGVSWGTPDVKFSKNWDLVGQEGMYRTSYHVLYTDQSILAQADNVWYQKHPERDICPRVIDLEVDRGDPAAHKAEATMAMSDLVLSRDGIRPIIYSRYLLVNSWLAPFWSADEMNSHQWWLAQYLFDRTVEHPGPPTLPSKVLRENVVLHQTADKKTPFPGEVESLSVDWDRWTLGDVDQMRSWIAQHWGGEEPKTLEERVEILEREAIIHGWNLDG